MLNKDVKETAREHVIEAEDIGLFYDPRVNTDDYKSRLLDLLSFKKDKEEKKKTDKVWSLRNVTFTGYKGEILGIIGSNGAGKTTISKVITGILQHDEGRLHVDGNVTALFSLGMGFNKELTGRENVYLNGMMLGIQKELIDEYIDEIHAFSEIGEFIDQPMKYYSSGMKARLGFSVAANLQPEILILDEALNTGDIKFGRKASEKLKELVTNAKMVIIVTHSLRYAQRNCDRLIWLHKGQIKEVGDPKEVIANYRATVPKPVKKKRSLELEKTQTVIRNNTVMKATDLGISFKLNKGDKHWALRNLNFTIKEGEVVGIIGHNGAGKSTLCKMMTNILKPDEGALQVHGRTSSLLGYGTGFNPQLTGTDNIYLNGMLLGISKHEIEEKYDEIVEFSGIKRMIDKPMKNYSSGMKSRLGFSIAAVLKPDIFIIDEALSTGDLAFRQKATERIQEMMDRAKAVIIVTHSMHFVEQVCTRAIWIDKGQLRFDGDAEEAVKLYREAMGVDAPKRKRKAAGKKQVAPKKKPVVNKQVAGKKKQAVKKQNVKKAVGKKTNAKKQVAEKPLPTETIEKTQKEEVKNH